MHPSIHLIYRNHISRINNIIDNQSDSNKYNQNIPQPHRSDLYLMPTPGKIISSIREKYKRWRCKIKNIKVYFPIAVIIIKLEVMANKMSSNLLFLKEIGFRIRTVHIRTLVYPSMLLYLREQDNPNQYKTPSFAMINS